MREVAFLKYVTGCGVLVFLKLVVGGGKKKLFLMWNLINPEANIHTHSSNKNLQITIIKSCPTAMN